MLRRRLYYGMNTAALGGFDADVTAWIAAVVSGGGTVSALQAAQVQTLVGSLKAAGVWPLLDRLWLFAAENSTQALIDLVARATATAVNSPTFTANQGYAGNGTSSYINTGFVPSSAAGKFALSSASFGVYTRTARVASSSMAAMGAQAGGSNETGFWPRYGDGNMYSGISGAEATSTGAASTKGMWVLSRTGGSSISIYQGGSLYAAPASTQNGLAARAFLVGGTFDTGGSLVNPSTDQQGVAFIGGGLSAVQAAALTAAITAYLASVGGL